MVCFRKIELNDVNTDELIVIHNNQLSSKVERWSYEGSAWTVNSIILYHLLFQKLLPVKEVPMLH